MMTLPDCPVRPSTGHVGNGHFDRSFLTWEVLVMIRGLIVLVLLATAVYVVWTWVVEPFQAPLDAVSSAMVVPSR